jgi:hypothetical protein
MQSATCQSIQPKHWQAARAAGISAKAVRLDNPNGLLPPAERSDAGTGSTSLNRPGFSQVELLSRQRPPSGVIVTVVRLSFSIWVC